MDIFERIELWGSYNIFIEYVTIDQIVNGYGEEVAKGSMPAVTYTVNVIKDGDCVHELSCDHLKEALEDGLRFAYFHYSHLLPPYGGTRTLMKDLPVGTSFLVYNGSWRGEIVLKKGVKCILIKGDKLKDAREIRDHDVLDLEIEKEKE